MVKVLVVDDSSMMCLLLRRILVARGYQVIEARDGATAVRHYESERPDAVVLDLNLEDISGIEVLERLRQIDGAPRVILASATSAETEATVRARCQAAGARAFLNKPFAAEQVAGAIAAVLAA
ncbi:MAG: response regulator [Deltaproteobacteria bacterium]|nr:response regulator [Deltaproteobacteria bacterium]